MLWIFSIGSAVVAQWEDGGPWTHWTVVAKGDHNHNNRSYMIRIFRTDQIVTRNRKHINTTPITVEKYLRDQINTNTTDPLNEFLKNYEKLAQENVSNKHANLRREDTFMSNKMTHSIAIYKNTQRLGHQPAMNRSKYHHTKIKAN